MLEEIKKEKGIYLGSQNNGKGTKRGSKDSEVS
jgi:hypothetical protein